MLKSATSIVLIVLLCLCRAQSVLAEIEITDQFTELNLAPHIDYYEWKGGYSGDLAISDLPDVAEWKPIPRPEVNFFFSDSTYLYRIALRNLSTQEQSLRLAMKWPVARRMITVYEQQNQISLLSADPQADLPSYRIVLEPGGAKNLYMMVRGESLLHTPLVLYREDIFSSKGWLRIVWLSVFCGICLSMALYNLVIGLRTKSTAYIYYFAFQVSVVAFEIFRTGLGYTYVYKEWELLTTKGWVYSATFSFLFALMFLTKFLSLKTRHPKLFRYSKGLAWVFALFIATYLFLPDVIFISIGMCFASVITVHLFAVSFYCMTKGNVLAIYFFVAWGVLLVATLVLSLWVGGFVEYGFFAEYGQIVGCAFEAIILSLALSDRINRLQREKLMALAETKSKSEFLAKMSHEIRTPMNGVIGMSEMLSTTPLNEEQQYYNRVVRTSGETLLSIINDILDYSKIEADKMELEEEDIELPSFLESTFGVFTRTLEEKGLVFLCSVGPDVPTKLVGDPTRLRQIFMNLLSNAIKFTERGFIAVKISRESEHHIKCEILDTGIGISKEAQSKLFTSFAQADTSTTRKYGGTGLGLVISKQLVELMDGEVGIYSTPGKGSCFHFTANLIRQDESADQKVTPTKASDLTLVVSDEYRQFLKPLFERHFGSISESESISGWANNDDKTTLVCSSEDLFEYINAHQEKVPENIFVLGYNNAILESQVTATMLSGIVFLDALAKGGEVKHKDPEVSLSTPDLDNSGVVANLSILIAEDNPVNQAVMRGFIKKLGLNATMVGDGSQAVCEFSKPSNGKSFDLILMDCEMPEMDGFDATREIRRLEQVNGSIRTPIVAFTSHAFKEQIEKCRQSGMDDHLAKPVTLESLTNVLKSYSIELEETEPERALRK